MWERVIKDRPQDKTVRQQVHKRIAKNNNREINQLRNMSIRTLFIAVLALLFLSCNKDDDNIEPEEQKGILIEIEAGNSSYIADDGKHFYSNTFLSKNDTNLYRLPLEAGEKYAIWCTQANQLYSNIEMVLLNSNFDTITFSRIEEGKPEIFFDSNSTDELYLSVYLKGNYNESLAYKLFFEKSKALPLTFMEYEWHYTGNWQVVDNETLKLTNNDAQKFRWVRLDSSPVEKANISFTIKSATLKELPSFGFIGNGSTKRLFWSEFKEELPESGEFFHLMSPNRYRIIHMNKTEMWFDYGDFALPAYNLSEGVSVRLSYREGGIYESYSVFLNDTEIGTFKTQLMNKFYLVFEELGFDDIIINDLKIE